MSQNDKKKEKYYHLSGNESPDDDFGLSEDDLAIDIGEVDLGDYENLSLSSPPPSPKVQKKKSKDKEDSNKKAEWTKKKRKGKKSKSSSKKRKKEKKRQQKKEKGTKKVQKAKKGSAAAKKAQETFEREKDEAPDLLMKKGIQILRLYSTVNPDKLGTETRTPPVLIDWLPKAFFNEHISGKTNATSCYKKIENYALDFLNKKKGTESFMRNDPQALENCENARKKLRGEKYDKNVLGFSLWDIIGISTRYGYPRILVSWKNPTTSKITSKLVPLAVYEGKRYWAEKTLSKVPPETVPNYITILDRFSKVCQPYYDNQKFKGETALVKECWPTWDELLNKQKEEGKPFLIEVLRSSRIDGSLHVPQEEMTKAYVLSFPFPKMIIPIDTYEATKHSQLKKAEQTLKRLSKKDKIGGSDLELELVEIPSSKKKKGKQPVLDSKQPPRAISDRLVNRAVRDACAQIKSCMIVNSYTIPSDRLRVNMSGIEQVRDKASKTLSRVVNYRHNLIHSAVSDHFKNNKPVLVGETVTYRAYSTLRNPFESSDWCYINSEAYSEYKGKCPFTPYSEANNKRSTPASQSGQGESQSNSRQVDPKRKKKKADDKTTQSRGSENTPQSVTKKRKKSPQIQEKVIEPKTPEKQLAPKNPPHSPPPAPKKKKKQGSHVEEMKSLSAPSPPPKRPVIKKRPPRKHIDDIQKPLESVPYISFVEAKSLCSEVVKFPGEADKDGRISNLCRIIPKFTVSHKYETNYVASADSLVKSILSKTREFTDLDDVSSDSDPILDTVVTHLNVGKDVRRNDRFGDLLTSQTSISKYLEERYLMPKERNPVLTTACLCVKKTCPSTDILRVPLRIEERKDGELHKWFNGSNLIMVMSLNGPCLMSAKSRFHKKGRKVIFVLNPQTVALFSRDIQVDVIGVKGKQKLVPKAPPGSKPSRAFVNNGTKCLHISYLDWYPISLDKAEKDLGLKKGSSLQDVAETYISHIRRKRHIRKTKKDAQKYL